MAVVTKAGSASYSVAKSAFQRRAFAGDAFAQRLSPAIRRRNAARSFLFASFHQVGEVGLIDQRAAHGDKLRIAAGKDFFHDRF